MIVKNSSFLFVSCFFPSPGQFDRSQVFGKLNMVLYKFSLNIQNYPTKYNILVTEVTLKSQKYVKKAAASCAFEQALSSKQVQQAGWSMHSSFPDKTV